MVNYNRDTYRGDFESLMTMDMDDVHKMKEISIVVRNVSYCRLVEVFINVIKGIEIMTVNSGVFEKILSEYKNKMKDNKQGDN